MNLSKKQKLIVTTKESKVVVIAAAAAGKTAVMTERIKYLLNNGIDPKGIVAITFTNNAANELYERLGKPKDLFIGTVHAYANYLLLSHGIATGSLLETENFDGLFRLVEKYPDCIKPVVHLLLDEAQDSDDLQFKFIMEMVKPKNYMLVGDYRQCQPKGTKILLRGGEQKNIEDIVSGDDIVYYDVSGGRCSSLGGKAHNAIHKKVIKTGKREFNNDFLISIKTENNKISSYTPNHRTYVKLNYLPNKQVVYLMCDSNYRFRVGQVPLFYTGKKTSCNPWRTKMKNEGCEKIWLLKICDSAHEASVEEAKISYKYQIPQTCWQIGKVSWTKEEIDYIYQDLDTKTTAKKCLEDYSLNINYPLLDFSLDWSARGHYAINATVEIYASNLIPEYMSCLCFGSKENNHSNKHYENIIEVNKKKIVTPIEVYSLETESGNYIADGIVTHNCIYQFNGANPSLLLNLTKEPFVTTYDLNENYRNGSRILYYAKNIIEKIGYSHRDLSIPMRGIDGIVEEFYANYGKIFDLVSTIDEYGDWFILTRTNDELYDVKEFLESKKIPCDTFKKAELTNAELAQKMKENTVKILTIHSSKGLEAKNVIVMGARYYNDEEKRVSYVAATRARDRLYWAISPRRSMSTKRNKNIVNWE